MVTNHCGMREKYCLGSPTAILTPLEASPLDKVTLPTPTEMGIGAQPAAEATDAAPRPPRKENTPVAFHFERKASKDRISCGDDNPRGIKLKFEFGALTTRTSGNLPKKEKSEARRPVG